MTDHGSIEEENQCVFTLKQFCWKNGRSINSTHKFNNRLYIYTFERGKE